MLSDIVSHLRHLSHLSHLSQDKTKLLFSFFFSFIQLCDSRKIHYLTREFRVNLHLKTDIALIASRFVRYRFSLAMI